MPYLHRAFIPVVAVLTVVSGLYSTPGAQSPKPGASGGSTEWPTYGHDPGGNRFSPLTQLTPANVGDLEVAWECRVRPTPPPGTPAPPPATPGRGRGRGSGFAVSGTTPLMADGLMYLTTPYRPRGRARARDGQGGVGLRGGGSGPAVAARTGVLAGRRDDGAARGVRHARRPADRARREDRNAFGRLRRQRRGRHEDAGSRCRGSHGPTTA